MRVLVIGGAGYIGSVLVRRLLDSGHETTVLDSLMFGAESLAELAANPRFQLVPGDVRDAGVLRELLPGQDAVVLLAAIVGEPACNRDPAAARSINLDGALQVLREARQARVARFVFGSTCSNYGISDPAGLADENSPLQPLSVYAETKVAAEQQILAAADSEFCPIVLRFSTAFGVSPRMRFDLLVSDFTLAALREGKIVIYGEQFWRPFVHIADIARAIELSLGAPRENVSGQVFNIGSNSANLRKLDLGEAVQRELPDTRLEFVAQGTDPRSYRVDFSKAARQLGFRAQWTVPDGIREVLAGLREGRWLDPQAAQYRN